ncbi:unnamed protein product [Prorocentrum cordatum]|uniref:RanBP2-type domain-containing protein n=1 Tax=Prorocentrum cordatum TaxID=2364126 RepID=A0ABN9WTJ6_9DINO|nr:unnamed protein product [Polarella glacialis]
MSARPPPGFGFPLTAAAGFGPSAMLGGAAASRPAAPPPEGSWVCAACQNVNFPTRSTCNARACGRPRAEVDGGPPPAAGAAAAAPEGSWTCPSCGNVNFPTRAACNRRACGLPRPAGV